MQLILLSFGIAVGALIAGVSLDEALTNEAANTLGDWAPWLGVVVFGVGAFVHFSGPPRSLGWLLARAVRRLDRPADRRPPGLRHARRVLRRADRHPGRRLGRDPPLGPPSLATFLPAFWLLVPGAVGLIGMAEFVGSNRAAGLDHFVNALITFISIGIGVLVGNALVLRFSRARDLATGARGRTRQATSAATTRATAISTGAVSWPTASETRSH